MHGNQMMDEMEFVTFKDRFHILGFQHAVNKSIFLVNANDDKGLEVTENGMYSYSTSYF